MRRTWKCNSIVFFFGNYDRQTDRQTVQQTAKGGFITLPTQMWQPILLGISYNTVFHVMLGRENGHSCNRDALKCNITYLTYLNHCSRLQPFFLAYHAYREDNKKLLEPNVEEKTYEYLRHKFWSTQFLIR